MGEQLGFEKDRRIRREYCNKPKTDTIGGQTCHFRSEFEWRWAGSLQFLKDTKQIHDWQYESHRFPFDGVTRGPYSYLPDFLVFEKVDKAVWQECKGELDSASTSKLHRMFEQYPSDEIELVMLRLPKKGNQANRLDRIRRKQWVRRVIDASVIFRQMKGLI